MSATKKSVFSFKFGLVLCALLVLINGYRADIEMINTKAGPCEDLLGSCVERCEDFLKLPGTDCENGQVCCLLLY